MIFSKNDISDIENAVDRYLYNGYDVDFSEEGKDFSDMRHKDAEMYNITF